jgi:hypothetical protein
MVGIKKKGEDRFRFTEHAEKTVGETVMGETQSLLFRKQTNFFYVKNRSKLIKDATRFHVRV